MTSKDLDTHRKALKINLDKKMYGTIAEIGAGQEVARWFFRVGGASGTIAKTMSAYDDGLRDYDETLLSTASEKILSQMRTGDPAWEAWVPSKVVQIVKERKLFSCPSSV